GSAIRVAKPLAEMASFLQAQLDALSQVAAACFIVVARCVRTWLRLRLMMKMMKATEGDYRDWAVGCGPYFWELSLLHLSSEWGTHVHTHSARIGIGDSRNESEIDSAPRRRRRACSK
ncbi:MAG: hypothetical protein MUQ10_02240, partial [Anaerolineae bacterium]|nr:hypothetical protein [Anaerolineae bacterium]